MTLLSRLHHWDERILSQVFQRTRHRKIMMRLVRKISRSGDGLLYVLIPITAWFVGSENAVPFCAALLLAFTIERPLYYVLKNSLKRKRPAEVVPNFNALVIPADRLSFPSGHTSAAFCFATTASLWFVGLDVFLFGWATAIGISRDLLGAHFPGDIIAGAVMGIAIARLSVACVGLA